MRKEFEIKHLPFKIRLALKREWVEKAGRETEGLLQSDVLPGYCLAKMILLKCKLDKEIMKLSDEILNKNDLK